MNKKLQKKLMKIIDYDTINKKSTITKADITDFENKYNIYFTEEYKEFLFRYGGCYIKDDYLYKPLEISPVTPKSRYESIGYFYGINIEDIIKNIEVFREVFKEKLFPIADADGGDLICIGLKDKYKGKIFYWYHESEIANIDELLNSLFLIAENFESFINSIEYHKEDIEVNLDDIEIFLDDDLLND